jgi:hypothetical protein
VGHRGHRDFHIHNPDGSSLYLGCHHRLLTQWARRLSRLKEGMETGGVKTVTARQELRRFPRRMKGFKADRAVRQGRIGRTGVSVEG